MTEPQTNEITLLLHQINSGDREAADKLCSLVYSELHQLASGQMRRESPSHTLQSTALVHEAWMKLVGNRQGFEWKNRGHFFVAASNAMRRILVDAARARQREKRGGSSARRRELRDDHAITKRDEDLMALNEALEQLALEDPAKAELVNLRYFGGFTNKQAAEKLGISSATAERHWTFARAWLRAKTMDQPD